MSLPKIKTFDRRPMRNYKPMVIGVNLWTTYFNMWSKNFTPKKAADSGFPKVLMSKY